ncbi:MAG: MATE family efflux transporter [Nannocystaceae bacterium]|nr:MATE family efflux transporter [Nannocystaceae bacterium]
MSDSRQNLLSADPKRALISLAVPTLLGIVFILAVNLIDTYFVGQLGTDELAAMSFTFPVATLVTSVGFGLGIGTTSAVSRALGSGDSSTSRRLVTHGLLLGTAVVLVISLVGVSTQDAVFRNLGAEPHLLTLLSEYMTIWYAGAVFLVVPMIGTGALRASGDAKTPAVVMAVAAASNVVLDPMFIFGFGPIEPMGIEGAAIATVISRALTLLVTVVILVRRDVLDVHVPSPSELWASWRQILSVGIPASISNAIVPIATAVMTALVASYGAASVAGFGIASRLESFVLIPGMALTAALTPFIGQNWGGHHPERVAESMRLSTRFVLLWGLGAWLVLWLVGDSVAGIFTDDPTVIEVAHTYMWIVPASYGAAGLVSVVSASFNAVDRAVRSTILSALRSLVLAVPLAFLGAAIADLQGVFVGIAVASLVSGGAAMLWSRRMRSVKASIEDPVAKLRGLADRQAPITAVVDGAREIEGLRVAPRPINTVGFYVGDQELGHVHATGHIDLHVPLEIHDALLELGKCDHHRHLHDISWITHRVDTVEDIPEALWLLRLTASLYASVRAGHSLDGAALRALELPPALAEAAQSAFDRTIAAQ